MDPKPCPTTHRLPASPWKKSPGWVHTQIWMYCWTKSTWLGLPMRSQMLKEEVAFAFMSVSIHLAAFWIPFSVKRWKCLVSVLGLEQRGPRFWRKCCYVDQTRHSGSTCAMCFFFFFPSFFFIFLSENMDGFDLVLLASRVDLRPPEATMPAPFWGATVTSLAEWWAFLPGFQKPNKLLTDCSLRAHLQDAAQLDLFCVDLESWTWSQM